MLTLGLLVSIKSVLSGAAVGFVLGLIGGGGSILAVPLLLYFVGMRQDPHVAIGTTALAVAVNAALAGTPHVRQGRVSFRIGLPFAAAGVLGALVGSRLGLLVQGQRLLLLFAIIMLFVSLRMWQGARGNPADGSGAEKDPAVRWGRVVSTGVGTGLLSGFFGIGGGFLIVPGLMWSAGIDIRRAVGTSLVSVAAFGLSTGIQYALAGKVNVSIALLYVLGGVLGGLLGPRVGQRMDRTSLQRLFAVFVAIVGLYMVGDVLHIL